MDQPVERLRGAFWISAAVTDQGPMLGACSLLVDLAALWLNRLARAVSAEIEVSLVGRRWSVLSPYEATLFADCQDPLAVAASD